jgi:hypothetical protein
MTTFKIFFNENDIRRIRFENVPSYEEFVEHLQKLYPHYHVELAIKYNDLEGDRISVSSQLEWEEMYNELIGSGIIKIYIEEGPNADKYFKDGPAPEPVCLYEDVISKVPLDINAFLSDIKENVPRCLESFFRDGRIIPSNIPSFLADAIKPKYLGPDVVDLDIDVYKLFDLLHAKSMECLESVDRNVIIKGKEYLLSMLQMVPDHTVALYNLACAESLLNNIPESLQALEKAVQYGYQNITHMLEDKDLDNIKGTDAFIQIIEKIQSLVNSVPITESVPPKEENIDISDSVLDSLNSFNSFVGSPVDITQSVLDSLAEFPVVLEYDSSILDSTNLTNSTLVDKMNTNLSSSFIDLRLKWEVQIVTLRGLGFRVDDEVLSLLLEQYNGNTDEVVQILLQNSSF